MLSALPSLILRTLMVFVRTLLIACLSVTLSAQTPARRPLPVGDQEAVRETQEGPLGRHRASPMRRTMSGDSARLDALTRAGNLYLSLKDAIALTVENNLDVAYQRITPLLAEADLMRARAGGIARGVPSKVREGPPVWAHPGQTSRARRDFKISPTPADHRQLVPPSQPQ